MRKSNRAASGAAVGILGSLGTGAAVVWSVRRQTGRVSKCYGMSCCVLRHLAGRHGFRVSTSGVWLPQGPRYAAAAAETTARVHHARFTSHAATDARR